MELALPFSAAEAARIKTHAARNHMSVIDFVRQSVMARINDDETREAQNAEFLAMLDESERQIREGRVVVKTMAELEAMAAE